MKEKSTLDCESKVRYERQPLFPKIKNIIQASKIIIPMSCAKFGECRADVWMMAILALMACRWPAMALDGSAMALRCRQGHPAIEAIAVTPTQQRKFVIALAWWLLYSYRRGRRNTDQQVWVHVSRSDVP